MNQFRTDRRFIDQLFRNLKQSDQEKIRQFIQKHGIDISFNYPRNELKVPAIVILLKNETENQAWLGDSMGLGQPEIFSYDGGIAEEVLAGTSSAEPLDRDTIVIYGPKIASGGTANTIEIDDSEWFPDQFVNKEIRLVAGTGMGQVRDITANDNSSITVDIGWATIPGNDTIFEVRELGTEVVGEPSKLYDRRNETDFIERRGGYYNASYQIQIIGNSAETTIFLYIIVKAIFTLSRIFLEGQGILNMKIGGTDFLPRTEYQPDFAYMRALNLEFITSFDIFEDIDPLVNQINIVLEGQEPDLLITPATEIAV